MRVVDLSLPLIYFYHVALETCEFRSEDLKKGHSHIQWLGNISEGLSSLLSWAYTSERLNERRLWFVLLLGLHCIYLFCTIWTFTFSVLWQRSINKVPYNLTVLIESLILELPDRQCDVNCELVSLSRSRNDVQGDHSTCSKPPVDFKTKVPFWPGQARPMRNFGFEVKRRFWTSGMVTLYLNYKLIVRASWSI